MISSLTDCILLGALAFTGWRTLMMGRELRRLRSGETELAKALRDADQSINRAAHAVVMLRSEGLDIIAAIDERITIAHEVATQLEDEIRVADRKLSVANDGAPRAAQSPQDTWLAIIESRLASGSPANR